MEEHHVEEATTHQIPHRDHMANCAAGPSGTRPHQKPSGNHSGGLLLTFLLESCLHSSMSLQCHYNQCQYIHVM